jgi:hypothetical protein
MSALDALAAAKTAGVTLILDGDGIVLRTQTSPLPVDIVDLLKAAKPDLMRILECREAALAALKAEAPPDCGLGPRGAYGIRQPKWDIAMSGLRRFLAEGWGDKAALVGWTREELYRAPALWSQVHLTGAALMIGDGKVIMVSENHIVIETRPGAQLKFRRAGEEAVA